MPKRRRVELTDTETGEVAEYVAVVQPVRSRGFSAGSWMKTALDQELTLARLDLRGEDYKVLHAMNSLMEYGNLIQVAQSKVADLIGMKRQNVKRCMDRLVEREVLVEGPKIGNRRCFMLNPEFGWKGDDRAHVRALDEHRARRRAEARIEAVIDGGRS